MLCVGTNIVIWYWRKLRVCSFQLEDYLLLLYADRIYSVIQSSKHVFSHRLTENNNGVDCISSFDQIEAVWLKSKSTGGRFEKVLTGYHKVQSLCTNLKKSWGLGVLNIFAMPCYRSRKAIWLKEKRKKLLQWSICLSCVEGSNIKSSLSVKLY